MEGILADGAGIIRKNPFLMRPNVIVNRQEYNPPAPEKIDELLQDLIKYIAVDQSVDILIKSALVYYQFETINPFNSGNGRVGRLLPALLLMKQADYYLLHAMMDGSYKRYDKFHLWDFVKEQKEKGLIKHIVFSFHAGPKLLDQLIREHPEVDFENNNITLRKITNSFEALGVSIPGIWEQLRPEVLFISYRK